MILYRYLFVTCNKSWDQSFQQQLHISYQVPPHYQESVQEIALRYQNGHFLYQLEPRFVQMTSTEEVLTLENDIWPLLLHRL